MIASKEDVSWKRVWTRSPTASIGPDRHAAARVTSDQQRSGKVNEVVTRSACSKESIAVAGFGTATQ